jgi:hypothetical protein
MRVAKNGELLKFRKKSQAPKSISRRGHLQQRRRAVEFRPRLFLSAKRRYAESTEVWGWGEEAPGAIKLSRNTGEASGEWLGLRVGWGLVSHREDAWMEPSTRVSSADPHAYANPSILDSS